MKHWFKKILIIQIVIISIISSISANKSNWSGMDLSADEITNSIHFQLSRGGNCIGEFEKLKPTLNRFIEKKLDATGLVNILGEVNNISNTKTGANYLYYLTENVNGCRVNFVIENTNLISYNFENCK